MPDPDSTGRFSESGLPQHAWGGSGRLSFLTSGRNLVCYLAIILYAIIEPKQFSRGFIFVVK